MIGTNQFQKSLRKEHIEAASPDLARTFLRLERAVNLYSASNGGWQISISALIQQAFSQDVQGSRVTASNLQATNV